MNNAPTLQVIAHHFIGGIYAKSMLIPEDCEVVSHKHNYDHMSVLTSGCAIVEADGQQQTYWAPSVIEIKAGVAHSVRPVNGDAHWLCLHKTDCTDVDQVDNVLIQPQAAYMRKLPFVVPVNALNAELAAQPELWNQYTLRTADHESPHNEADDIWIRYRDWNEFDPENPQAFSGEHTSVWYPAYQQLPSIEWILAQLHERLGPFDLGGVLITRIRPGHQVYPHSDAGRWHSEWYSTKVLVLLSSAPDQKFCFANGEEHEGAAGEVFTFDNRPVHWVTNDSDVDRISLIFAIKRN